MEDMTAEISAMSAFAGSQQTQPAKRKFFQWAVRWFYANISEERKEKPDAATLACLLQSIGFKLREFEKNEVCKRDNRESKKERVKVTIECGTSGMRALLEMDDVKCQCPNSEDAKDASFWSVTGTGPNAAVDATDSSCSNKIEESGCNLLPQVSKDMNKMLNEVTYRLLNMIDGKCTDANHNDKNLFNLNKNQVSDSRDIMDLFNDGLRKNDSINIVRSRTQPEIAFCGSNIAVRRYNWIHRNSLLKESVSRMPGWDERKIDVECESIDGDQPRPSPPKIASSPVILNELSSSLGQLSLQSEEENGNNLAEHVIRAHRCLEKAVEILMDRRSPLSRHSPNYEEGTFLKPPTGGLNLSTIGGRKKSSSSTSSLRTSPINVPNSRPGSSCSMPARIHSISATNKQTIPKKSPITRRSVGSVSSSKLLSTTPVSSISSAKRNVQSASSSSSSSSNATASGLSKIPGRRKSFGALTGQSLKLSLPTPSGTKKNASATIPPEDRTVITAKRIGVSPDSKASVVQTTATFHHQTNNDNTSTIQSPALSTPASIKTINQTSKESSTRKYLANTKFGFSQKKPS